MDRRTFLAGTGAVVLTAPLAVQAQQGKKVWRIGFLFAGAAPTNLAKGPFRQGLHDLGYVEGRDFVIEYRWAEGHPDRLPELAAAAAWSCAPNGPFGLSLSPNPRRSGAISL